MQASSTRQRVNVRCTEVTGRATSLTLRSYAVQSAGAGAGLRPSRSLSRGGVGAGLGYAPLDATGTGTGRSGSCPCGDSGSGAVSCSCSWQKRRERPGGGSGGLCVPLFDSPQRASHSMHHAYSLALEYARSACCGDCTSTMLSRRGITFRDPEEARGDVSAGSDGVSGAGASGSAGGRAGSRGGRAGP